MCPGGARGDAPRGDGRGVRATLPYFPRAARLATAHRDGERPGDRGPTGARGRRTGITGGPPSTTSSQLSPRLRTTMSSSGFSIVISKCSASTQASHSRQSTPRSSISARVWARPDLPEAVRTRRSRRVGRRPRPTRGARLRVGIRLALPRAANRRSTARRAVRAEGAPVRGSAQRETTAPPASRALCLVPRAGASSRP